MIDLHCHVLPGIDDGPSDLDGSVRMAEVAAADGIRTIVATPHVRDDHPYDLRTLPEARAELNAELDRRGIPVRVVQGGEVALPKVRELDDEQLAALCLGDGSFLLVESPYTQAGEVIEATVFDIQARGFRVILAHPERCPSFLDGVERLEQLVGRGVLCSITAASLAGRFGGRVEKFSRRLVAAGLVHNVATDAHDHARRPPELGPGLAALERDMRGSRLVARWMVEDLPGAVVAGSPLPPEVGSLVERKRMSRALARLTG